MYTFQPGDTIYIDTGAYDLYENVTLGPQFTGVRIIGAGQRQVTPSVTGVDVLADGPVAFWRLGDAGGATAADSSGNGYNGSYVGDVAPDTDTPTNDGAAYFSGDDSYVTVPYSPAFHPSQVTIEAWVNFQGNPGTQGQSIVDTGSLGLVYQDGNLIFGDGFYPWAEAPLACGAWTFVAATLGANGTATLYINGAVAGTPGQGGTITDTGPLEIGSSIMQSGEPTWQGAISDVALYNKTLTAAQIQSQFDQEVFTGTTLNRDNTSPGSYAIVLNGASDVTIQNLSLTGGNDGIYAEPGADSVGLTVQNVGVYGNVGTGIDIENTDDDASIIDSVLFGSTSGGIHVADDGA